MNLGALLKKQSGASFPIKLAPLYLSGEQRTTYN
jgi:hypothetical protein